MFLFLLKRGNDKMLNVLRKDIYLMLHKKIFIYCIIVLTVLFSYLSLNDIQNVYTSGYSYQHHFLIAIDYGKHSFLATLFYVIPILVVFPFADTWLNERNMTDVLFTRANKRNYFVSKYIVSFLTGFLVLALPLLISFIAEIICLDFHDNQITILPYIGGEHNMKALSDYFGFYSLYRKAPYAYLLMYIGFVGAYGGLCATVSFSISLVCRQKVVTYIAMFFVTLLPMFLCTFLPVPFSSRYIQALINPYSSQSNLSVSVYLFWLALFVLGDVLLYAVFKRRDPLE